MHVTRGILDKKTGAVVGQEPYYVENDECNRADTTLEGLVKLPPHFDKDPARAPSPPATPRSSPTAPAPRS